MALVSPAMILTGGGISLAEAVARRDPKRCSVGLFCGEHTELEIPASILEGKCCCCRAGTRHHA